MRSTAGAYGFVLCILLALAGSVGAFAVYRDPFPLISVLALIAALLISATDDRKPRA